MFTSEGQHDLACAEENGGKVSFFSTDLPLSFCSNYN